MSRYYALVAGLPELSPSFEGGGRMDFGAIRREVRGSVGEGDAACVEALLEGNYDFAARSGSRFMRAWCAFDRDMRNVLAALTARRLGVPVGEAVRGGGVVVEGLVRSGRADVDYFDRVSEVMSSSNLLEREHALDRLRWDMADELAVFNYFDIDAVLAYLVKVRILERWAGLNAVRGREVLGGMVG